MQFAKKKRNKKLTLKSAKKKKFAIYFLNILIYTIKKPFIIKFALKICQPNKKAFVFNFITLKNNFKDEVIKRVKASLYKTQMMDNVFLSYSI